MDAVKRDSSLAGVNAEIRLARLEFGREVDGPSSDGDIGGGAGCVKSRSSGLGEMSGSRGSSRSRAARAISRESLGSAFHGTGVVVASSC